MQVFKQNDFSCDGPYLHDFCDGQLYREHPLFKEDRYALQLILYYDEVEVANPLGSYRGTHKLGKNNALR